MAISFGKEASIHSYHYLSRHKGLAFVMDKVSIVHGKLTEGLHSSAETWGIMLYAQLQNWEEGSNWRKVGGEKEPPFTQASPLCLIVGQK